MTREEALKLWLPVVVMGVSDGRMPEVKEAVEMAVKALEQQPVLDKIISEIEQLPKTYPFVDHYDIYVKEEDVIKILIKYKAESED